MDLETEYRMHHPIDQPYSWLTIWRLLDAATKPLGPIINMYAKERLGEWKDCQKALRILYRVDERRRQPPPDVRARRAPAFR